MFFVFLRGNIYFILFFIFLISCQSPNTSQTDRPDGFPTPPHTSQNTSLNCEKEKKDYLKAQEKYEQLRIKYDQAYSFIDTTELKLESAKEKKDTEWNEYIKAIKEHHQALKDVFSIDSQLSQARREADDKLNSLQKCSVL